MLLELLPERLQQSPEDAEFQQAVEKEIQKVMEEYDRIILQLFVTSADANGLSLWEKMYGITPDSTNIEYRRSRVMSKMRGSGTTTTAMIKNVCESFYNGKVEIIERFSQYSFDIKFLSSIGTPPNLQDVVAVIEEIKPAHLSYRFIISYNRHQDLTGKTHEQLSQYTHQQLREEELN